MKKLLTILIANVIAVSACKKSNDIDSIVASNTYTGQDLNTGECLLDSIDDLSTLRNIKFYYIDKSKMKLAVYSSFGNFTHSMLYSYTSAFNYVNYDSAYSATFTNYDTIKISHINEEVTRMYVYEDDDQFTQRRKLGSYFSYSAGKLSSILNRTWDVNNGRDSNLFKFVYQGGNLDSVNYTDNFNTTPYPQTNLLKVNYSSSINKLNGSMSLLRYSLYSPFEEYDNNNFRSLAAGGSYSGRLNQIIFYTLSISSFLPESMRIQGTMIYFKYNLNANGYPTSIALGFDPNFDPILGEVYRFYYICN